jgi:hypothetical protein
MSRGSKGTIYRREGTENWWLDYYDAQGKRVRRSAGSSVEQIARGKLRQAVAAAQREQDASDPRLRLNDSPGDSERNGNLTEEIARLLSALKHRLAFEEILLPKRVRPGSEASRKLEHLRAVLTHCIAVIDQPK